MDYPRDVSLPELEAWVQYGFALSLSAMATAKSRDRLHAKALEQQRRLRRQRRPKRVVHPNANGAAAAN